MDIVPILSAIILISTIITLIVAIASYMTFRVKERRKQQAAAQAAAMMVDADGNPIAIEEAVQPLEPIQSEVAQAPIQSVPVQAAPSTTTNIIVQQPPVVLGQPYQQPQPYGVPVQQGYPAPQQAYYPPQAGVEPQPVPQQRPPEMLYGTAQAAFMKAFGGPVQTPQQQTPGEDPSMQEQPVSMRQFSPPPPQQKRPAQGDHFRDDSASWK